MQFVLHEKMNDVVVASHTVHAPNKLLVHRILEQRVPECSPLNVNAKGFEGRDSDNNIVTFTFYNPM